MLLRDLAPRQKELVRYIAEGYTNEEITRLMGVTMSTVKNMISRLCDRTGAANRQRLVLHFYRIVRKGNLAKCNPELACAAADRIQ